MDALPVGSNPLPYLNEFVISTIEYDGQLSNSDYVLRFNATKGRGFITGSGYSGSITFDDNMRITSLASERRTPARLVSFLRSCGFAI